MTGRIAGTFATSANLSRRRFSEKGSIASIGWMLCTSLAAAIYWERISNVALISWLLISQLLNVGGYLLLRSRFLGLSRSTHWGRAVVAHSAMSGLCWTFGAIALLGSTRSTDNVILLGLIIVAAAYWHWCFLSSWLALILFNVFAFGPAAISLLTHGTSESFSQAALFILSGVTIFVLTYAVGGQLMSTQTFEYHDALTGLPNRTLFQDRLKMAIELSNRMEVQTAILFLDLDDFKRINDRLGQLVGDMLLRQVARRLTISVRAVDTVARLSGNEFAIILINIKTHKQAGIVAQRITTALSEPFVIDGHNINTFATVGITLYPSDASSIEELLKSGEDILYYAKKRRPGSTEFYSAYPFRRVT